jgi:hypothetical protein
VSITALIRKTFRIIPAWHIESAIQVSAVTMKIEELHIARTSKVEIH